MDNNKIRSLENLINQGELEIKSLKDDLERISNRLIKNKKRLLFLKNGGEDCFEPGTKLLFKDEDDRELLIVVVWDYKEKYNALLLTNYSDRFEGMCEYFIFDYNCIYTTTLVECLEKDYDLTFVKVVDIWK